MSAELAVDARDLVKVFPKGNVRALDGVSLEVPAGECFGLLGPNGAGKTTLVRILSTILTPDSGSASIFGLDVQRQGHQVRLRIGLAGQYATVDENLTGMENLKMIGRLCRLSRDAAKTRAAELLELFGLADAATRPVKTYSGGMRRRLDLAASLVASPPLLFLDEPTSGLDPQSRQDLFGVIERLVADGTTILLTTQYLEEADRLCKELVVVDHGHIIAAGKPADLKAGLGETVIALTLGKEAEVATAVGLLADLAEHDAVVEGTSLELTVDHGPAKTAEALRRLDGAGVIVTGIVLREPSLDDVFLSLTGRRTEAEPANEPVAAGGRRGR
ncbi:MAG TPA: ATP-binding cassette domain-containing protein [Acidimicrobiales bacterium]|jgi:daunorubicin resistance ABC transporter ATP-binding subunit|nr:ATP-binding cassette domain-containing protein [Acidimicrobiales bacterium]